MTTNVSFLNPSIQLLREAVERKLGHSIHSLEEIQNLSEAHLNSRVSEITIRRLWGLRADSYNTVRRSTLDALAQFVDYTNFDAFEQYIQRNHIESTIISSQDTILASSLKIGDIVILSWLPDRCCKLQYEGNDHFVITAVNNSRHLRPGCTFTAHAFTIKQPLQLNNLTFAGVQSEYSEVNSAYAIATQHGLSSVDVIA